MNITKVVKIGVTAAVLSILASLISFEYTLADDDIESGLWIRVVLVALALLGTALFFHMRLPRNQSPELTLFAGLLLGWALNPFSWIGRSYAGQIKFDAGVPSGAADLIYWAMTAAAAAAIGHMMLTRSERR